METRPEANSTEDRVDYDTAHGATLALAIGGDNDVDVLRNVLEGLVELLGLLLQFSRAGSILFIISTGLTPLVTAWHSTICVCTHMPDMQSTITKVLSVTTVMTENEFPYQAGSVEAGNLISTVLKKILKYSVSYAPMV